MAAQLQAIARQLHHHRGRRHRQGPAPPNALSTGSAQLLFRSSHLPRGLQPPAAEAAQAIPHLAPEQPSAGVAAEARTRTPRQPRAAGGVGRALPGGLSPAGAAHRGAAGRRAARGRSASVRDRRRRNLKSHTPFPSRKQAQPQLFRLSPVMYIRLLSRRSVALLFFDRRFHVKFSILKYSKRSPDRCLKRHRSTPVFCIISIRKCNIFHATRSLSEF